MVRGVICFGFVKLLCNLLRCPLERDACANVSQSVDSDNAY